MMDEAYNKWGAGFMTISGGEPFLYNDNGKTLFDLWEKYSDMFFLVYTNGTCITKEVAERIAKLGNVTTAISVEGFEKETDERRGPGVFKRILQAMQNLREAGVPFGISVTGTSKNIDILLGDEFYKYFFDEQGATYMWQFQLMPVGRAKECIDLAVNPEQRVALYKKWKTLLKDDQYCVADFWNSGILSNGCIAYGKGYLYVNWDGKIMPCVFVPYHIDNIKDLHAEGKTITDALFSDLFKNGRKWQCQYGLDNPKEACNWLMPCSIRDNYDNFRKNILTKDAKPENDDAKAALEDPEFYDHMVKYDKEVNDLTEPIWKKDYLESKPDKE
jgi:MoaA/NifB/PqqE/SkfB family radical SAM enzyme